MSDMNATEVGVRADGMPEAQEQQYYKKYWMVFIALCVCTAISFVFNWAWGQNATSATAISVVAIIKAALVVLIFMHLLFDWKKVAAIMVPVLIMCVMTVIILSIDGALAWHEGGTQDQTGIADRSSVADKPE